MPSPSSAMFAYTSSTRRLGQVMSISTVKYASRPLRKKPPPFHRNRLRAVCWVMVLAPRRRPGFGDIDRGFDRCDVEAVVERERLVLARDHRQRRHWRDFRPRHPTIVNREIAM